MTIHIEFDSDLFKPFLPEVAQVNPETYGAELAFWLAKELASNGIVTTYPIAEDWGWLLTHTNEAGKEYSILCRNRDAASNLWWCTIKAPKLGLFSSRNVSNDVLERLTSSLMRILSSTTEISNVVLTQE